jgi:hypothetical protein
MIEHLEVLERLARLRESGVLTDEEFAAEKKRVLEGADWRQPDKVSLDKPAAPGGFGAWPRNRRWALAGATGAIAVGGLLAYLILLDVNDAAIAEKDGNRASSKLETQDEDASGRDLAALLTFNDPAKCVPGEALRSLVGEMAARQPSGTSAPIELPGTDEPVTPGVRAMSVEGSRTGAVVAQLPLDGSWRDLSVTALRTISWPGTEIRAMQLRFNATPDEARRILNEQRFDLPAVGETRRVALDGNKIALVGVEEIPGGAALTCVSG